MKLILSGLIGLVALTIAPCFADDAKDEAAAAKSEAKLEATTLANFSFEDAPLKDVMRHLAKTAGVNIVVDRNNVGENTPVSIELSDVTVKAALDLVLMQHDLARVYLFGAVQITTREGAKRKAPITTKIYDVRDIAVTIRDFEAPEPGLKGESDRSGGGSSAPGPDKKKDDAPGAEELVEMIREQIEPTCWGDGRNAIRALNGQLVVSTSHEIHKKIAELLATLRAAK